ncbi:MAG TPA: polyprenyl diphosphate synthase [Candidatus Saccharibacteria bacterium]|nr:polyprenyl diphosphate synthase [Candidatus Saccharibacteria bacterium]HMT39350.1 polyprenyl diphosphate synthase [Candidatus Saccharibacteria bacterium]
MTQKPPLDHIGFILDGNRRWAKQHGLKTIEGHMAGYKNLKKIAESCWEKGISYMSCYLFSTENWRRSNEEVSYLMSLTLRVILKDAKELHAKNVRLKIIGSREKLDKKLVKLIEKAEELTKDNTAGTFIGCFNYGGRNEIVDAVKKIVGQGVKTENIDEELIKSSLYTADIPAPDLIVRTSGEKRLSNFLLWDSAYSELSFVDKLWPDFNDNDLDNVLSDYTKRKRRFGS